MAVIVRRFDGEDLVITAADLVRMGVKRGQFVAVRPMQPLPLSEPRLQSEDRRGHRDLDALWQKTPAAEEGDVAAEQEDQWEQWARGQE